MSIRAAVLTLAIVGLASTARAGDVTISFTTGATNATYANGSPQLTFAGTNGIDSVSVKATGWSTDDSTPDNDSGSESTRVAGLVGWYGGGLGVTNSEDSSSNEHTLDNWDRFDFIQFDFTGNTGKKVEVKRVVVNAYSVDGDTGTDITYLFTTDGTNGWRIASRTSSNGNTDPYTHTITGNPVAGVSFFDVFASLTEGGKNDYDGFKIVSMDVTVTNTTVVPLPPAAIMGAVLMAGLGGFTAWRRRRSTAELS